MGFNKRHFTRQKICFYYREFGIHHLDKLVKNSDGITCDCSLSNEIIKHIFNNELDLAESLIKQIKSV